RGELLGVLCIESETPYRFHEQDRATVELLGSYLAIAIQNMMLRERAEATEAPDAKPAGAPPAAPQAARRREIVYYRSDECVLIDGEYLVRSLPANIFW